MTRSHPGCTLELVERRPSVCTLTPDDVRYLWLQHRTQVRVGPTGEADRYRLTSLGYVGAIRCPDTRLLLRPKIPLVDLFHLLQPDREIAGEDDLFESAAGAEALNFLAAQVARLLRERLAHGLERGYRERQAVGSSMRGRLDVAAQVRQSRARRDRLHCRFEDFTADIPCNQVPRTAIELLLRSPWLAGSLRAVLGELLRELSEVSPIGPDLGAIQKLTRDRHDSAYGPLLSVCELLLSGLEPQLIQGKQSLPAFLLNMDQVFEQYVCVGLQALLPSQDLRLQSTHVMAAPRSQPNWRLRPDLAYMRDGTVLTLLDTKWKQLRSDRLPTDDLYQLATYCTAMDCKRGILVYPGSAIRCWRYRLGRSGIRIEVRSLCVTGGADVCRRALRALASQLTKRALPPRE